jgi:hypothetical protein
VREIDCSRGDATVVRVVEPLTERRVALIIVVPAVKVVASPVELTLATLGLDEFQFAAPVRSWVLLSLYVPIAVNCWESPTAIEGRTGVMAIDCSVGLHIPALNAL